MFDPSEQNLRARLRCDTKDGHDRVDRLASSLDLNQTDDLRLFLSVHRDAFRAMRPYARGAASGLLDHLIGRLDDDLHIAGKTRGDVPVFAPAHPVAIDYLVFGSRLGTETLKRRWPGVEATSSYFAAPFQCAAWPRFCRQLAERSACGEDADQIVTDARRLFDVFAHLLISEYRGRAAVA